MANFKEVMQEYVNLDYSSLLNIANNNLAKLMPVFNSLADDGNGAKYLLPFICTSLAADGKLSSLEYKFVNDLLEGIDYDTVLTNVQDNYNEESFSYVDKVYDACGTDLQAELLSFCLCFCAVDETVSRDEISFINRLLA